MARTVNPQAVAAKRNEILDATHRLLLTRGFEQVSIRDILEEVQISSGAFHHYFDSRGALLDALIARMRHEVEQAFQPILQDPHRSAIAKLQGVFNTLNQVRTDHQADIVTLLRIWYSDANAVVRLKVDEVVLEQRTRLLSAIIAQGIREGSFHAAPPDIAANVVLALLHGMSNRHASLLLQFDQDHDASRCVSGIVASHAAYMDAIERVLGAPDHSFARAGADTVMVWVAAMRTPHER